MASERRPTRFDKSAAPQFGNSTGSEITLGAGKLLFNISHRRSSKQSSPDCNIIMFGLYNSVNAGYMLPRFYLDNWTICVLIIGLFMATPIPKNLATAIGKKLPSPVSTIIQDVALLMALLLCVLQVASNTYSAFIYFQF